MKVQVPGKLILSGEHAVVYGKPALAIAINRYAQVETQTQLVPIISFDLGDLAYQEVFRFTSLSRLKERIKRKYQRFLRGDFNIREVLKKPVELTQFAFSLFSEILPIKPTQGVKIKVRSDIPIGCGLGSSAAIILAVIHAIAAHFNLSLPKEKLFHLALEAENLQHGYSSGLDLRICQEGGCLFVHNDKISPRSLPQIPFYLVNTGTPQSSTGECVAQVAHYFHHSQIGDDFENVTKTMDQALQSHNVKEFQETVRQNQKLLTTIGVVPDTIQRFVQEIEEAGGAAKVCGAGAVSGEKAGTMLVLTPDLANLTALCSRYHYSLLPASIAERGVDVII